MRQFAALAVVLALVAGLAHGVAGPDTTRPSQVAIEIKVCHQEPDQNSVVVRANPTFVVSFDRPFQFHAGGTIEPEHTADAIQIGTRITGKLVRHGDGPCGLSLTIQIGEQCEIADDDTDLVRSETLDIRTTVSIGKTKHISYADGQALEITLTQRGG